MATNRQNIFAITLLLVCWAVQQVQAKDFGVMGHTYQITEQDIIQYIKEKLGSTDMAKLQTEQQETVRKTVERPQEVAGIIDTKEPKEYFYDPTFTLEEDLVDHEGVLIHAAGTKVNPLEKLRLTNDLVFINGDNKKQVEFALAHYRERKSKTKIILTKGSPIELQKTHKTWFYFDQLGMITGKFGIKQVPAIVAQDGLVLKINEVLL